MILLILKISHCLQFEEWIRKGQWQKCQHFGSGYNSVNNNGGLSYSSRSRPAKVEGKNAQVSVLDNFLSGVLFVLTGF